MAEKIRYTRKDLKEPDEFITWLGSTITWLKENRLKVALAVGAAVVIFAAGFGVRAYFRYQERQAAQDLWPHLNRAREYLQSPTTADADKLARLEQFLTAHVHRYPDAAAAVYTRYYLGSLAGRKGNFDLAASHYRAALASGKAKDEMVFLLRLSLAQALEAKGDLAAAAAAYQEAAGAAGPAQAVEARMGEARSLALSGKKQEAATVYRRILADSSGTRVKEFVELRLAQLE